MMNEELDTKVLELIRSGVARAGLVRDRLSGGVSMRDVDNSLQRLRRRGFIVYGDASRETTFFGWRVVAEKIGALEIVPVAGVSIEQLGGTAPVVDVLESLENDLDDDEAFS